VRTPSSGFLESEEITLSYSTLGITQYVTEDAEGNNKLFQLINTPRLRKELP
jgi:hypothetical protein